MGTGQRNTHPLFFMKRWKIAMGLAAVFIAGAVVGHAIAFRMARSMMLSPPSAEEMSAMRVKRLTGDLDLSPEQIPQVESIVVRTSKAMAATHGEMFDRLAATMDSGDKEIEKVLLPEQRRKFDELKSKRPEMPRRK